MRPSRLGQSYRIWRKKRNSHHVQEQRMTPRMLVMATLPIAVLLETGFDAHAQLTEHQKSLRDYYNTIDGKNEEGVFNPAPNAVLAGVVKTLKSGRALDVGMS